MMKPLTIKEQFKVKLLWYLMYRQFVENSRHTSYVIHKCVHGEAITCNESLEYNLYIYSSK